MPQIQKQIVEVVRFIPQEAALRTEEQIVDVPVPQTQDVIVVAEQHSAQELVQNRTVNKPETPSRHTSEGRQFKRWCRADLRGGDAGASRTSPPLGCQAIWERGRVLQNLG